MPRNPDLLNKRNEQIRKRFNDLRREKYNNKPKYSYVYCLEKVAEEYFLAVATVEHIVNSK